LSNSINWINTPAAKLNAQERAKAISRQNSLTKPEGSLGRLEEFAISLAAMQGNAKPQLSKVHCCIFTADHGIAQEGISAFPQTVTGEMIRNFSRGGAAICVLSREIGASLEVINLGTVDELESLENVTSSLLGLGTNNFSKEAAMDEQQLSRALHIGRQAVERAKLNGNQLFIGGEMGIGNTTSATALICSLLDLPPEKIAGPGTGLDQAGLKHKISVIKKSLKHHKTQITEPLKSLQHIGGFEIAALVGAFLSAAQIGVPMLIDGFIASSAALTACHLNPDAKKWMIFSHTSAEPGHRTVIDSLGVKPIINLNMRLGEGSGAATVVPLLRLACRLHNEMATFDEANVSNKN